MRQSTIFLLVIFLTFFVIKKASSCNDILGYHTEINKANRALYDNDFLKASEYFFNAFEKVDSSHYYYIDLKNAIISNAKTGNYNKNNSLFKLMICNKGLKKSDIFKDFSYSTLKKENISYIDSLLAVNKWEAHELKNKIDHLFILDQKVRDMSICQDKKENNISQNECYEERFRYRDSMDAVHALLYINYINKFAYPTENNIGYYHSSVNKERESYNHIIYVLTIHFLQTKYRKDILNILDAALTDGNIHPSVYATFMDFVYQNYNHKNYMGFTHTSTKEQQKEWNYMNTPVVSSNNKPFKPFVFYTDSLMQLVDNNRIKIGLDSLHIVQQQIICTNYCEYNSDFYKIIAVDPYTMIEEIPYGFVKAAFKKEEQNIDDYKIDYQKIIEECDCKKKLY